MSMIWLVDSKKKVVYTVIEGLQNHNKKCLLLLVVARQ
jgi:hypothetical protein